MRQYITEGRAIYEDAYHGLFSRKLARWAIGNMKKKSDATGKMESVAVVPVDDVAEILHSNKVDVPDAMLYTAWYVFHMAMADYCKLCKTDEQRALYVEETLFDPDGDPTNVLACFEAKMENAGITILWERYL